MKNKVLCKKSDEYRGGNNFIKNEFYTYNGNLRVDFCDEHFDSLRYKDEETFKEYFYTVEETKAILRQRKIKSILNDE